MDFCILLFKGFKRVNSCRNFSNTKIVCYSARDPKKSIGSSLAKMQGLCILAKLLAKLQFNLAVEMDGIGVVIKLESTHPTLQTKECKAFERIALPEAGNKSLPLSSGLSLSAFLIAKHLHHNF